MSSRKVKRKRFDCGHKGFGKECHRCESALKFKAMSESGTKYQTFKRTSKRHKGVPAPKGHKVKTWTPQELMNECDRLLENAVRL